jgi:hypothetical protein
MLGWVGLRWVGIGCFNLGFGLGFRIGVGFELCWVWFGFGLCLFWVGLG